MINGFHRHLLTVLIPNYNYGNFIGEAIDSVLAQDYPDLELIIVDDGSDDDSVQTARERLAGTDRLHHGEVIALDRNRGKLGAMNAALDHLNGEYLITLDADDRLSADYASRCIAKLQSGRLQDATLGFVYTDCFLVDQAGSVLERGRSTTFDRDLVDKVSFLPEPALMLTRAFRNAAPFDETIRVATKHHKWRRVVADGWSGSHIPEALFYYRMHAGNLSGIGERIMAEVNSGRNGERILSGYWRAAEK